jgi:osmotically-inducible protein OsmY
MKMQSEPPAPTDEMLAEAVSEALCRSGNSWLKSVAISATDSLVILKGKVPTYYLKQLAQATVLKVPGVQLVRNEVEVGEPAEWVSD